MRALRSRMKKSRCELHDTPQTMLGTIVNAQAVIEKQTFQIEALKRLYKAKYKRHITRKESRSETQNEEE